MYYSFSDMLWLLGWMNAQEHTEVTLAVHIDPAVGSINICEGTWEIWRQFIEKGLIDIFNVFS